MHQICAGREIPSQATLVGRGSIGACLAYRLHLFAPKGKFCGVMQDQDRAIRGTHTISGYLKVAAKNLLLTDPIIVEKSIGRFCICPVACLENRNQQPRYRSKPVLPVPA